MKTMPHLHDDEHRATSSESEVVSTSSRDNKQQDHQHQANEDGNGLSTTNETKAVDRLLSLAATASRHAPPRETEPSNESPNVVGTKASGVGNNHPAVTPSPLNALNRPAHQHHQQQWMGTNQLQPGQQHSFQYNGPMYSVYQGTKPIVSSPIRCRSPATNNNNDRYAEHLSTTTPKKLVVQKAKRDHADEQEDDRCASPPRTRKVTVLDSFHRFQPAHQHHHQYHHNMVALHGSMILPQSPIHHQRQRNGQATNAAGTAVATPPFHWSSYPPPQHHGYHPYMTSSFAPTTMHSDVSGNETPHHSNKRPVPPEEREDVPNAKRRLSLPVHESSRTVSGDSHPTSSREESGSSDDPKKFETSVSKKDSANEDERHAELLASNRVEPKDEKQRVISPSSSNDGASKGEDDEFSSSTASCIPPKVEFGTRVGTTKGGATVSHPHYPPPTPMMPHPVHHARNLRGAHAMYSPFPHHHHHHHPAMHMGYPPARYGLPPGSGWYTAMGPPSGLSPPFPYSVMSQMGSTQPSSQHTSRPASPAFPAKTMFPHRSPPLSPLRSPNRDVEEVTPTPSSRAVDGKEPKSTAANPQPLSCSSQASTPSSMERPTLIAATTSSQPIKSVADWQKATIATGMAPSANRCVPLKAPIPTKYWGESNAAKDLPLPDFHRLVNFPDYLTKTRPNQADGGVVAASKANGQRNCVMCGSLRLCSAATSQLASSQRSNRNKGADAGDDDEDSASQKKGGAMTSTTTHIIPRQNKGLCTACDVTVWVVTETGTEIKWCKGCKNFRPWVAFGDKGLATKCVRCRDRQREKYALQKEESGRCGRRPSQSPLVRRRSSSTPQPPQLATAAATTNQESGDSNNNEDAEHVAAARGLRNLMAASI